MSILLPHFITPFLVAGRGKAKLKILELVSPYLEKPKVRHVSDFNFGSFTSMNNNCVTPFLPIWGCCQGKAKLEMLALVIPYSENTIR